MSKRNYGRAEEFFATVAKAALAALPTLLKRWLPDGHREGSEWVALNPRRKDHARGSFKINLKTGRWADFATGDRGGDAISLLAYLRNVSQRDAAHDLSRDLGMPAPVKRTSGRTSRPRAGGRVLSPLIPLHTCTRGAAASRTMRGRSNCRWNSSRVCI
ncbi:hypothetical protein [Microvirga aerophila]|uniref:Zinc finger CHC2-type domain-containing protein n=1 Tax=Microvirga aerophila TaxID=670291 RepID=A0A512BVN6_9HYPH|nr:hypothetical protein [Microvirga aerophila]GEO16003.1 hypothetical protein MAE02_36990 [Microvirga aerophila]